MSDAEDAARTAKSEEAQKKPKTEVEWDHYGSFYNCYAVTIELIREAKRANPAWRGKENDYAFNNSPKNRFHYTMYESKDGKFRKVKQFDCAKGGTSKITTVKHRD